MRIWTPTITSARIRFSQRFQNLAHVFGAGGAVSGSVSVDNGLDTSGGGYVRYLNQASANIWQLPWWSVYVEATVPAAGSARTLVTCGDPTLGDVFELGIDSSNRMQLIGGSTVVSDDAVTAGERKMLFIFSGGQVEFWADGVRIGTAVVSLGTNNPQYLFVGVAADGSSRKWGDTIKRVDVYTYPLDEVEAFQISAIEGWTPKNLLTAYGGSYADGMYFDGDEDGSYTLNTQPDVDQYFSDPALWNIGSGHSMSGNRLHINAPAGVSQTFRVNGVEGNRYSARVFAESNDGQLYTYFGAYVGFGAPSQTGWIEAEVSSTTGGLGTRLGIGNVAGVTARLRNWQIRNLSCTHLNPYGSGTLAGKTLTQATPVNMGWKSTGGPGVSFDGVADYARMSESFSGPVLVQTLLTVNTHVNYDRVYDGAVTDEMSALLWTAQEIEIRAGGGSVRTTGSYVVGTPFVITALYDGANSFVQLNDDAPDTGTLGNVSTSAFTLGASGSLAIGFTGATIRKRLIIKGDVSPVDRNLSLNYLMRAAA
jgi:hypothetical protein